MFNVFAPTKLPKFTTSTVELLMAPYMIAKQYIHDQRINTNKSITNPRTTSRDMVFSQNPKTRNDILQRKIETALSGYVTYTVETLNKDILKAIKKTLATAKIAGIGKSTQNDFGATVV